MIAATSIQGNAMKILLAIFNCAALSATALAATPDATGVMVGAPPPATQQVTLDNWLSPQFNAWSFQHVEAVMPTTTVDRGTGPVSPLDAQPYDLSRFEFADFTRKKRNLAQFLEDQHIVVVPRSEWSIFRRFRRLFRRHRQRAERQALAARSRRAVRR